MKIYQLKAENFKGLKVVQITPEGNVVQITGKNGQGKTSVLDGICAAFCGRFAKSLDKPVRTGAEGAEVTVETEDLIVTRKWNADGKSTLRVENKEGKRFASPQSVLDALVGALSFDPMEFSRQKPREQRETLLSLVDLGYDPDEVERRIKAIYDERTVVGRELKTAQGAYDECPVPPEGTLDKEVSVSGLMDQLREAEERKKKNDQIRRHLHELEDEQDGRNKKIAELEKELAMYRQEAEKCKAYIQEAELLVTELVDPNIELIKEWIASADERNANYRLKKRMEDLRVKAKAKQAEYDGLTEKLNAVQKAKADALAAVKFPVVGLGFDADGVTFNGIPFAQASSAEQLKVSLGIAMELNPRLRVIRITDGSLLDEDSMAEIRAMAEEKDYQVWIECVDSSGKVGVVIEDGTVKEGK